MARPEEPLFARVDSDDNLHHEAEEEDALLTGEPSGRGDQRGWKLWREVGLFAWALVATAAVIILAVVYQKQQSESHSGAVPRGKRNLIMMVSDGMGPTSLSLTRSFKQYEQGLPWGSQLTIDQHLIGQSRTRSTSSLVTDSAAGATAFSCGLKSYNGAISVLDDHSPCGTVLEAAKKAGYMTGLVVTTRITDATPACFAAHVNMRSEEDRIAEQLMGDYPLGRVVDLILGGGRCHFLPNTTAGSCRADDKDIIAMGKKEGFEYVGDRAGFDGLKLGSAVKLPLLGLFADTDIPYEIDRRNENDVYPSLDEMAQTALKALSAATKDSDKGFFLMIEGSRIDHAGHANDPAAQVHEVLAYDDAFATVLEFLDEDSVPGVMVSTSDHETGGLATARRMSPEFVLVESC
jgi:alkaline phosphatase